MTARRRSTTPEQLMNVLLAPVVSEKSTRVADKNRQYVFRVADAATKPRSRPRSSCCSRPRWTPVDGEPA